MIDILVHTATEQLENPLVVELVNQTIAFCVSVFLSFFGIIVIFK